ncbi:MAG: PD40 domain-containing protein [Armatimonadetes bacterium]|nr:PD40 domain-containing protein [Armatimonadota bacterium]
MTAAIPLLTFVLSSLVLPSVTFAIDDYGAEVSRLEDAGEIESAFQAARKWMENEPDNRHALQACGRLAMRCGAFSTAADCYEALLFLQPDPDVSVRLASALHEIGRADEALSIYQDALAMDRANVAAHVGIGRILLDDPERRFEARLSVDFALAAAPEMADALTARAEVDLAEYDTSGALQRLLDVIARHPDAARARLLAGKILAQRGQTAQAREHWLAFTRLEPCRPETWVLRNNLYPLYESSLEIRGNYFLFSPDGTQIAYTGAGATANRQLLVCSAAAPQDARPLLTVDGYPSGIGWSPDGTRLALRSYHEVEKDGKKTWEYELRTVNADGTDVRLVHSGQSVGIPCWHPDGKRLCFDGYVPRRGRGILIAQDAVNAPQEVLVSPPPGYSFQHITWSPTGTGFVTLSVTYTPERLWRLSFHPADKPDKTNVLVEDPEIIYYPSFMPDGKSILFLMRNARKTYDVYATPVDGSLPRPACAFKGTYYASPPSAGPDARRILVYSAAGATLVTVSGLN